MQEQAAVIVTQRAIANLSLRSGQLRGQAIEAAGRIAARKFAIVHAQQADHLERHQPHRHHLAEGDATGQERLPTVACRQCGGEPRAQHRQRHRRGDARLRSLPCKRGGLRTQAFDGIAVRAIAGPLGEKIRDQGTQRFAPCGGRARHRQRALPVGKPTQRVQQSIQHQQRAAFQRRQRRNAGHRGIAARGMPQQQAVQCPGPAEGRLRRRIQFGAMVRVQAPARAGVPQPFAQAVEISRVQFKTFGDGRHRQQVEHIVNGETRAGQCQQAQQGLGHGFVGKAAAIAEGERNGRAVAGLAREYGLHERRVGIDVRCQHRDIARLQPRVAFQQIAQLVVQHLHLAQPRVAGVHLQAAIGQRACFERSLKRPVDGRRPTRQQITLQVVQQPAALQRIGRHVQRKILVGVHHFVGKQGAHEIAAGRPIGAEQWIFAVVEHGIGVGMQAFARGDQVAPPAGDGRQEEKMQRAGPSAAGDHPQHIRRNILAGEGKQARRQADGDVLVRAVEARQVGVQPAPAVAQAARGTPPQLRLPVAGIRALVPAPQPVAPPGLVLLERLRQLASQRPGRHAVVCSLQQRRQRREYRLGHGSRIAEHAPQAPAQYVCIADRFVACARYVGIEGIPHEFAGRQETQVGGDAMGLRQRLLQPATHRRLRDQDSVGFEQRTAG